MAMEEVPELGGGVGSPRPHLAAHVARAVRATWAVRMASLGGSRLGQPFLGGPGRAEWGPES